MASEKHNIQQHIIALLGKFSDPDPDIRYMSLNDLYEVLNHQNAAYLSQDRHMCARVVEGLLKALEDQNGEVQNQALKCLSPLAPRLTPEILIRFMENLTNLTASPTIDTSVPNTALRILVTSTPHPDTKAASDPESHTGYKAVSCVLVPRLVGSDAAKGMLTYDPSRGFSSDAIDVLIETVKLYGSILKTGELEDLQRAVRSIIEHSNAGTVVIKRALTAISILATHLSDDQLSGLVSDLIESFRSSHLTINQRRHLIATIGALSKAIPKTFGPYLKTLAPFVLSPVSELEMAEMRDDESETGEHDPKEDELRETAFVTLDTLLTYCSGEMQGYLLDTINAALRYLTFDPNVADTEDEEMGGTQDDGSDDCVTEEADDDDTFDDFEEEDEGYSDIDDMSWKVRRCAAKVLLTAVVAQARAAEDGSIYQKIVPALLARFSKEREESVKLEVISSVTGLVKKASEGSGVDPEGLFNESLNQARTSRKRRRQDSDAVMIDHFEADRPAQTGAVSPTVAPSTPMTAPQAEIVRLTPAIIQGVVKLWKRASIPLKQASILLLRSLALVRYNALGDFLQQIEDPIADALKIAGAGGSVSLGMGGTVGAGSLQIEALSLVSAIAGTHISSALLPFLIALIPEVVACVSDKNYKVSSEALGTVEQIAKALTPPRFTADDGDVGPQLAKLYEVVVGRIVDSSADLEVRQRAIHVLGTLIGRSSGPQGANFISAEQRAKGLEILVDRLKNEMTRLAVARAIDDIATYACSNADVTTQWVGEVTVELAQQLRKSDRALRGSCLEALKNLSINPHTRAHFDPRTIQALTAFLSPLLDVDDLHLLTPALIIFSKIIPTNPQTLVDNRLIAALCSLVRTALAGTALKAFLYLVRTIGEQGAGAPLMKAFLQDVGVGGDPSVVGRAIGTLLVHGGPNIGVKTQDFLTELQQTQDNQRKSLSLAILGEVGLRMGPGSSLAPQLFISNFASKSDKVRLAAAVALGNAGANNIKAYLPVILEGLDTSSSSRYLLLHSLKEILQHPENVRAEVAPFATKLWEILLAASDDEDNRAVGAECIGRLALIDPPTYIPILQKYVEHPNAAVRGTVISAFRYTLSDSSTSYNDVLRPLIVPVLITMLNDSELGNHRLALTTVNSAIHNKPALVLPHLGQLLPTIVADTNIKSELIREVQMGPFKHKVDDGLELRKSAYETLYTCLDVAFSSLDIRELFERVLAGISDEQDIRTLCNLMLSKLITLCPSEVEARLDRFGPPFQAILTTKPKESAVKQELEKAQEASMGVLKITRELQKAFPGAEASGQHHVWKDYIEWVGKEFKNKLREFGGI
ncbi:hypothetical protein VTO42DRAFT_3151 [Malbranchea cinnamomea]